MISPNSDRHRPLIMKATIRIAGAILLLAFVAGGVFYWNPLWVNDQQIRYHLWRANVRSKYVNVRGSRIHYFEAVPPDGSPGKPLLLLHGLGSRGEDWAPMIPSLAAAGFHVYAPDLLGYGRSPRLDGAYSVALEEGVVLDTMHAIGLTHADLDGWSMGGWIAAKIALDHPAMVDRLVLNDSAGLTFQPSFAHDAFVPTDPAGLTRLMALLSPHPAKFPPFVVRATLRRIADNGKIIQSSMDSMESGADLLDTRLSAITQPTLILWGTEDKLIPMAVGDTMHRAIPNSVFEGIVGCGHLAPMECPKPVLAGTIQFLKSQPPMQGGEQMLPGTAR
jgi:pimeloyl-ACP methyl ester carboxylesterase